MTFNLHRLRCLRKYKVAYLEPFNGPYRGGASGISGIISSSEAGLAAQSLLNAPMFGAEDGKKWLRSVRPDSNLSVKWLEAKLGC